MDQPIGSLLAQFLLWKIPLSLCRDISDIERERDWPSGHFGDEEENGRLGGRVRRGGREAVYDGTLRILDRVERRSGAERGWLRRA